MLDPKFRAASIVALGITADPALEAAPTRQAPDTPRLQLAGGSDRFVTRASAAQVTGTAERRAAFDRNKDDELDRSEVAARIASMK